MTGEERYEMRREIEMRREVEMTFILYVIYNMLMTRGDGI